MEKIEYQILTAAQAESEQMALYHVLYACVAEGASIGFTSLDAKPMQRLWQGMITSLTEGNKQLIVARQNGEIVATVIVVLDMPPNGAHRAEIAKLLVHPKARRQGIARLLLQQAEKLARQAGRSLAVLDTRSGDVAEQLYLSQGWLVCGQIPGYAISTEGIADATTVMYKFLQ
ncbi:GNAT family N-acetyltransferase [Erwinia pyri]|uniref:GNAT family N-acetyltransferase n=1 Tax=Erwinia pyri TaxID=3062598 RepID=A0AA50DK67_9GAMM|nr:GNAT family N-acetyltransferase [Erwinia sp. DE2]WLS77686.1 GNAT family N-acetyltransferase [Erwinia sp. DE2]